MNTTTKALPAILGGMFRGTITLRDSHGYTFRVAAPTRTTGRASTMVAGMRVVREAGRFYIERNGSLEACEVVS